MEILMDIDVKKISVYLRYIFWILHCFQKYYKNFSTDGAAEQIYRLLRHLIYGTYITFFVFKC